MERSPELAQQRSTLLGQRGRQARRRIQRLRELEELGRVEAAAASRALDRRPDVVRAADPGRRPIDQQRACLVGLVERPGDDDRVRARLERGGQSARGLECRRRREPVADLRKLEDLLGASVHAGSGQRSECGPEADA